MGKFQSLATRSITGVVYVALILGCIFFDQLIALAWVLALFAMLGMYEYQTMVRSNLYALFLKIWHSLMAGLPLFIVYTWIDGGNDTHRMLMAALPLLVYFVFYLIGEIYRIKRQPAVELGHAFFSMLYISLPLAFLLLTVGDRYEVAGLRTFWLLPIFVTIWLNDTGAYLVGSLIGKHKLIQRVSPNKTWEGTIGGAIIAILGIVGMGYLYPGVASLMEWIGLGAIITFFGTFGDLFESFVKRSCGVKDSGKILPGHGGILDRIDSLLMVAIPAYLFINLVIL